MFFTLFYLNRFRSFPQRLIIPQDARDCNGKGTLLLIVEQRKLVAFGQISEDTEVRHKVDNRLADLGAVAEIIFREEFSVSCRKDNGVGRLVAQTLDRVDAGIRCLSS